MPEELHGEFGEEGVSANALLKRLDEIEQFKHYHYHHETFARALAVAGIKIANRDGAGTLSAV
ncbi:hypothetical protein [Bradyrhizobium sp. USDA 10063]